MNELTKVRNEKIDLENKIKELQASIDIQRLELHECQEDVFRVSMRELLVTEIFRFATLQFSRLRREKNPKMTQADVDELDKWIGRAHHNDGLQDIIDALKELDKYKPLEIRGNLYALIQKIIIAGPFHGKKKK